MHRRAVLVALLAGAALQAAPAIASEPLTTTVAPTRVEFIGDNVNKLSVTVTLSGGEPGTLFLEMVDASISPTGGWLAVPYGSTPETLQGVLTIAPPTFEYRPSAGEQRFTASLVVDRSQINSVLLGSLRATVKPDLGDSEGLTVTTVGAVEIQVLAAPGGADLEALPASRPALGMDELSIQQLEPWSPVDRLLPDLPWVVNHGPIGVAAMGRNIGTLMLDSRVTYEFTRLSPFALLTGASPAPVLRVENRPRYLLPDAPFTDLTTSLIPVEGAPSVDSLPFIGFVRVTATAKGGLAGVEAEPVARSRTFLVFPWKEALFLFVVWLFQREWRHRKGRGVHAGDSPPPPSLRARIREAIRRLAASGPR